MRSKRQQTAEFGDFQTPAPLAEQATRLLQRIGIEAETIIEPTCGRGAFVISAAHVFPGAKIFAFEINAEYLDSAKTATNHAPKPERIELAQQNFFDMDWRTVLTRCRSPILVLGNPPWVTNSGLSAMGSSNAPSKSNFHGRVGIDAITGKSNFDISEWMLIQHLEWLRGLRGTIAVLCKTAVARKVLMRAWRHGYPLVSSSIYEIDARLHFGVAVDACLLVVRTGLVGVNRTCEVFASFEAPNPYRAIGFQDGVLISDQNAFQRSKGVYGSDGTYAWRSGIKHDCSKVMELTHSLAGYRNGFGQVVDLESSFLYPMLKSSDIGNGRLLPRSVMLVPQKRMGEHTAGIAQVAPKTWSYLIGHRDLLAKRGSSIYRNKPEFSVFGVGAYSFTPWKIAISGFYKKLRFECVGPYNGKPVVFDDTINFLPCRSEHEAALLQRLLSSDLAKDFFESMIFWSEKRPITVDLLKRLSIRSLANTLGCRDEFMTLVSGGDRHNLDLFQPQSEAVSAA